MIKLLEEEESQKILKGEAFIAPPIEVSSSVLLVQTMFIDTKLDKETVTNLHVDVSAFGVTKVSTVEKEATKLASLPPIEKLTSRVPSILEEGEEECPFLTW